MSNFAFIMYLFLDIVTSSLRCSGIVISKMNHYIHQPFLIILTNALVNFRYVFFLLFDINCVNNYSIENYNPGLSVTLSQLLCHEILDT